MQNIRIVTMVFIFFELLPFEIGNSQTGIKSFPFCILKTIKDTVMKLNRNTNQHETIRTTQKSVTLDYIFFELWSFEWEIAEFTF